VCDLDESVEDRQNLPVTRLNYEKARRERIVREHGSERVDEEFREQGKAKLEAKRQRRKQAKNSKTQRMSSAKKVAAAAPKPLPPVGELLARMENQDRRVREETERKNSERERERQLNEAARRKMAAKRRKAETHVAKKTRRSQKR
jgi:hypothetical protein